MTTQLVPSERKSAHAPSVAGSIAVPAPLSSIGTTFDDADITVCARIVLTVSSRPVHSLAVGSVSVIVPARSQIMWPASAVTV